MRRLSVMMLSATALASSAPAFAADGLKFGPPPSWVTLRPIPPAPPSQAPVAVLLSDQQVSFDGGKITTYGEVAFKIQNPQGLAAGNLSIAWQPATDTVTVNKLQIRRGDKVIDVLANGQTFTVLRRETNLEAAVFDGALTGNIQPEGLQEGDIVDFATTVEHSDPVLKGHGEAILLPWTDTAVESGHVMFAWPAGRKIQVREAGDLPQARRSTNGGLERVELSATKVDPVIAPSGAPVRFKLGRVAEASDYKSWSDVADLMRPLFDQTSIIPAAGPLHDEVERIRSSTTDPKKRAEQALALVQDRVRYVALLMNEGGYIPEKAETTWSRRYGDCKAKTALLLGILHQLGIEAEPVLVQSKLGDMVADRLPMLGIFDHVLVRASIAGRAYWLDGTRSGDVALDAIQTPNFGWGLPLVANASLVRIIPAPLDRPASDGRIDIDASAGIFAPATVTIKSVYRGDTAVVLNALYAQASPEQRDEALRSEGKRNLDSFSMTGSSIAFDKAARELTVEMKGTATLHWNDGWFNVPSSSIGFNADFDRAAGPAHDVPFATTYPRYDRDVVVMRLPPGFASQQKLPTTVNETLAGVEYRRSASVNGDTMTVETSERSLVPEVPYKDAIAAKSRIKSLNDDDVYLSASVNYVPTDRDLTTLKDTKPSSASEYFLRADALLEHAMQEEALADLNAGLALDSKNAWALKKRAWLRASKGDSDGAEKDVTALDALEPGSSDSLALHGQVAETKGDCAAAVDLYSRSIQKDSNQNFAVGHRAICERALSQDDQALADAALALQKEPSWTDLRVLRANIFMIRGDRDAVAREAELMVQQNPTSDMALVGAAKTYAALGQRDKAMQIFSRALAIKPYAYIYINRSEVRPPSDIAGRMADLDEALKLEPENPAALTEKAQLLSEQGKYDSAIQLLSRIKTDAGYTSTEIQRGVLMVKAGRPAEGQKLLEAARANAKTPSALNALCWTKATHDVLLESALQDCREALKTAPGNGAYLDSLGMVLLKLHRLDEALDSYNQAIAKGSGAASLMGRAFVYLRKGDRAHAEADAAAARKLSPDIDSRFAGYGLKF